MELPPYNAPPLGGRGQWNLWGALPCYMAATDTGALNSWPLFGSALGPH